MVRRNVFALLAVLRLCVESVIDGIPHPELRDRMILLRGMKFS